MVTKIFKNLIKISMDLEKSMKDKLNKRGINLTYFFRQAVQAEAKGDWKYNYMDDNELEEK